MMRLGVRYMVGMIDYRAGWRVCDAYTMCSTKHSAARAALEAARLVGATDLPEARPQIFLSDAERAEATRLWDTAKSERTVRMMVGPGGGFEEKCWPPEFIAKACAKLQMCSRLGASTWTLC